MVGLFIQIPMFTFQALLLLTSNHFAFAEGPPRKTSIGDSEHIIFAHENQQAYLKCPIDMTDKSTYVDWFYADIDLYYEPGYEVKKRGMLKIKNVTKSHAGLYSCEGVNGYGTLRVNITLIVDNPENTSSNSTPNNNSATRSRGFPPVVKKRYNTVFEEEVGGLAALHCVASGSPAPHIFWFRNGELINGIGSDVFEGKTHSTLKLKGIKKTDAGLYRCIARNVNGEDKMDFKLSVKDPNPPMIIKLEPPEIVMKEGSTAVFLCEVDNKLEQKLHIKWLKLLSQNKEDLCDRHLFRSGAVFYCPLNLSDGASTFSSNQIYKSKLFIRNTRKEDSGIYACLAFNDKGFNSKNVTLTVTETIASLSSSPHFDITATEFIVSVTIASVIVLSTIVFILHFCRKRKAQKTPVVTVECGILKQELMSTDKIVDRALAPHYDVMHAHAKSNLLCSDSSNGS